MSESLYENIILWPNAKQILKAKEVVVNAFLFILRIRLDGARKSRHIYFIHFSHDTVPLALLLSCW